MTGQAKRERIERFNREARAAGRLSHPNIVSVYDHWEENGRYFIAMEYLEGQTLRDVMQARGALSAAKRPSKSPVRSSMRSPTPTRTKSFTATSSPTTSTFCPAAGETDRLRHRPPVRRTRPDQQRAGLRHAQLHVAGTDRGQAHGPSLRPVFRRRAAVRDAGRTQAVYGRQRYQHHLCHHERGRARPCTASRRAWSRWFAAPWASAPNSARFPPIRCGRICATPSRRPPCFCRPPPPVSTCAAPTWPETGPQTVPRRTCRMGTAATCPILPTLTARRTAITARTITPARTRATAARRAFLTRSMQTDSTPTA